MAIITLAEVKTYIGETSTGYDTEISSYIPEVQTDVCEWCGTYFQDKIIYRESPASFIFNRGNTATATTQADYVNDTESKYSTAGFRAGQDVFIDGGSPNNGIYSIASVTTGVMTLTCTGTFEDYDQTAAYRNGGNVRISRIKWPTGIKPYVAKMIWSQISDAKPSNVSQERIDDYSVTYVNGRAYPDRVMAGMANWKRVVMI